MLEQNKDDIVPVCVDVLGVKLELDFSGNKYSLS